MEAAAEFTFFMTRGVIHYEITKVDLEFPRHLVKLREGGRVLHL